ncbi:MAG: DUF5688 family protein [Solobacterium sp.]|nr:DUF5688 family protein [Solobacterium sp.]
MSEKMEYCLKEAKIRLCVSEGPSLLSREPVDTASAAAELLAHELRAMDREAVCVINLDTGLKPINYSLVTVGSLNESLVPMESLFKSAILSNAANIMLVHNHPAGSVSVSDADLAATKQVAEAGSLLNIPLVDHIIVAGVSGERKSIRSEYADLFPENTRVFAREGKMDKEEFFEYVLEELPKIAPGKYRSGEFRIRKVDKPSESYTGLYCSFGEGNPSPVLDLDLLYLRYTESRENGQSAEGILREAAASLERFPFMERLPDMSDYGQVREKLFIRMMDLESNMHILQECPYKKIGGMAMTCYCFCGDRNGYFSSARIMNFMVRDYYRIAPEQLFEDAISSSVKLFPAEIGVLAEDVFKRPSDEPLRMVYITNRKKLNGASALFYPGVMEHVGEMLKGDYYVIPSSIHEMIAVRAKDTDISVLRKMLKKGNRELIEEGEWLSDDLYYYDAEKQEFRMITEGEYTKNYS